MYSTVGLLKAFSNFFQTPLASQFWCLLYYIGSGAVKVTTILSWSKFSVLVSFFVVETNFEEIYYLKGVSFLKIAAYYFMGARQLSWRTMPERKKWWNRWNAKSHDSVTSWTYPHLVNPKVIKLIQVTLITIIVWYIIFKYIWNLFYFLSCRIVFYKHILNHVSCY